jgi:hypothetical protein
MTTTIKAAAQWHGEGFELDDIPSWLAGAIGAGKLAFEPPTMTVQTAAEPAAANPGDWLMWLEDGTYAVATDADFTDNYEIAP